MIRGEGQKILTIGRNESWSGIKVSPVISFEGSFDRYIRKSVKEGSELIVILTNQASYGESGMSDQFILMSRANAVSNHRDIVHAAITGKSAFILSGLQKISDPNVEIVMGFGLLHISYEYHYTL